MWIKRSVAVTLAIFALVSFGLIMIMIVVV
jgi:hypothetical protein